MAKGILEEEKSVSEIQYKMQNYVALRKLSRSPLGVLIQKIEAQLALKGLSYKDSMAVFLQVLQGIAQGFMSLNDAPDFATCIFDGITAQKYFESLTPADASSVEALAKTMVGTKKVISPIVDKCLQGVDDILIRINQSIRFVTNWDGETVTKVLVQDATMIAQHIATSVEAYIKGEVVDGTAALVVMVENFFGDVYKADEANKVITA